MYTEKEQRQHFLITELVSIFSHYIHLSYFILFSFPYGCLDFVSFLSIHFTLS